MKIKAVILFWFFSAVLYGQSPDLPPPPEVLPDSVTEGEAGLEIEKKELVLPSWSEEELADLEAGKYVAGSSLLGSIALERLNSDNEEPIEIDPSVHELPDDQVEEEWPTRIEEQFLGSYFHEMPRGFLNDPQHLLTNQEFRDREGFLNYHARDTDIDLYVYLFDSLQEIPPGQSIDKVVRTHIDQEKPVAVVFYFLGSPAKSQLAFSKKVTESVPREERDKVLRMAVEEALEKSDHSSQLESFSIQLSIRLYWLEKVVARGGGATATNSPFILPETRGERKEKLGFWAGIQEKPVIFYTLAICGVAISAILLGMLGRRIASRRRVYVFPDAAGNVLLEAPHAPGVGGVISFASATEPPSIQKSDSPDYLHEM